MFLLICPFLAAGSYTTFMLTATNIDRGFNSVTSVYHSIFTQELFAFSNQKCLEVIKKKKLRKDRSFFTTSLIMGKLNLSSRQQVPRLQDKAEWLFYIIYIGVIVMQIAKRE